VSLLAAAVALDLIKRKNGNEVLVKPKTVVVVLVVGQDY
jgi:hypothetical protein